MKKLLVDADMLIYRMCSACQENSPFNKEIVIKACPIDTWKCIELRVKQCIELASATFGEEIEVEMCLSPRGKTFRYDLFPEYKGNRKGITKPVLLQDMQDKLKKEYTTHVWDNLEADDVLGILAGGESTIIVSDDKDLKQISTYHMKVSAPEFIDYVDKVDGNLFFITQCIAGDPTDGYYGVPGIGMKKAKKIIEEKGPSWATVVECYTSAMSPKTIKGEKVESVNLGLTEEDALRNARLAYILKEEDEYNKEESTVNQWNPIDWAGWLQG